MSEKSVREMYTNNVQSKRKTTNDNDDDNDDEKLTYKNIWNGQVVKQSTKYNSAVTITNKTVTESTLECSLKWQLCTMCPIHISTRHNHIYAKCEYVFMCKCKCIAMHRIALSKFILFLVFFFPVFSALCVLLVLSISNDKKLCVMGAISSVQMVYIQYTVSTYTS